jgi:hypothetical protein
LDMVETTQGGHRIVFGAGWVYDEEESDEEE